MGRKKIAADRSSDQMVSEPKLGHNSQLTDDERRALTLHHVRLYEAAEALVEKAKAERKAVADHAKADLGKGAMADIKDLLVARDEKVIKADLERRLRIARWSGLPVGHQLAMFDFTLDDRAAEQGKVSGMCGEVCQPPGHLTAPGQQRWIAAWHDGQAVLASAFAKKKQAEEPAHVDAEAA